MRHFIQKRRRRQQLQNAQIIPTNNSSYARTVTYLNGNNNMRDGLTTEHTDNRFDVLHMPPPVTESRTVEEIDAASKIVKFVHKNIVISF